MKEDLREKSTMSLEKTGNTETVANELLRQNKIGVPTEKMFKTMFQNHVQNGVPNRVRNK